jgi:enoyl-[acyl-carrier-protein] reductase (NADH)
MNGKRGLVTGVANGNSIAFGAARAFHEAGVLSDAAAVLTGHIVYADAGYHILG